MASRRRWVRAAAVAVLCGAAAAQAAPSGDGAPPWRVRDDRGREFAFVHAPQRIVTLLPSFTESVCALGGCDRLVGTDRFSNWPSSVSTLPKLGGLDDLPLERVVALKPDVVLAPRSASRMLERLEALGTATLVLDAATPDDLRRSLDVIATLLGQPAAAQALWQRIEADLRRAAQRVPAARRGQRVYFEVGDGPYAAGSASFVGHVLRTLGLVDVVDASLGPFPLINPEFLVKTQPDIVMAPQRALPRIAERPGGHALRALKQGSVCAFTMAQIDLLVRPGPRIGEAAGVIADCLVALEARR